MQSFFRRPALENFPLFRYSFVQVVESTLGALLSTFVCCLYGGEIPRRGKATMEMSYRAMLLVATLVAVRATPMVSLHDHRALGDSIESGPVWNNIPSHPDSPWTSVSTNLTTISLDVSRPRLPASDSPLATRADPFDTEDDNSLPSSPDFSAVEYGSTDYRPAYYVTHNSDSESGASRSDGSEADTSDSMEAVESYGDKKSEVGSEKNVMQFERFKLKGESYWSRLQHNLGRAGPLRDNVETQETFSKFYKAEGPVWEGVPMGLYHTLQTHGLGSRNLYQTWKVKSRALESDDTSATSQSGVASATQYPPYETIYNPLQGVMIVTMAFKKYDTHKELFHSDILFQTLLQEVVVSNQLRQGQASPAPFDVKTLSIVIQHDVVNEETNAVILLAYSEFLWIGEYAAKRDTHWRRWRPDGPFRDAFFALCGTDNVKAVVHMLNDYRAELGRKTIKEILTRKGLETDIWIVLEDLPPLISAKL